MSSFEGVAVQEGLEAIQKKAGELFRSNTNWAVFFREILGKNGLVHKLYPDERSLTAFQRTEEFTKLQDMLNELREKSGQAVADEATRVITVRLPSCLHEALKDEAHIRKMSMNQLCISKLLQQIEAEEEQQQADERAGDAA